MSDTPRAPRPPSGLDLPIRVTFFADKSATRKVEQEGALRELVPVIAAQRAPSKDALPWLKLATFGENRAGGVSLRNDDNLLSIYGVEADYDGERLTIEHARQVLTQAGIAAVLYASPSHTPQAPRWRVLCPTSRALPPQDRARLLARVNGLFVGGLSNESWTLSQSYYYGAVGEAPWHAVVAIDGRPIDLADELDATAEWKAQPGASAPNAASSAKAAPLPDGTATPYGRAALERECANITNAPDGQKHAALNKAAYSIGGLVAGASIEEGFARSALRSALESIRARCLDFPHAERTLSVAFADGMKAPRQAPPPHAKKPGIFSGFSDADLAASDAAEWHEAAGEDPGTSHKPLPSVLWVDPAGWDAAAVPKRPWCVPGYLMRGSVSVLSGQGAGGKSSLVVAWTISIATGEALGEFRPTTRMVAVNYNVEDDQDEQRRRYGAALKAQSKEVAAVARRVIRCGPHNIGTLFARDPQTGVILPTPAMAALEQVCADSGADVLVCDPLAELHNAEENDNTAMRAVVAAFRSLAKRLNIAVLILHHDRKGNNAPGDMDRVRGASAISGAVRVMLTLSTMSQEEAERFGIPADQRRRHFRIDGAKSNYAIAAEAEWWRLTGYEIPNGETVAAALPWAPPSPFDGLSMTQCVEIAEKLRRGDNGFAYGAKGQAKGSAAEMIATDYGLTPAQAGNVLAAWTRSGLLRVEKSPSPNSRHPRDGFAVDDEKFQEMRRQAEGTR